MFICNKVILWIREEPAGANFEAVLKMRPDIDSCFMKCSEQVFRIQQTGGQVHTTPYSIMEPADSEFLPIQTRMCKTGFGRATDIRIQSPGMLPPVPVLSSSDIVNWRRRSSPFPKAPPSVRHWRIPGLGEVLLHQAENRLFRGIGLR